MSGHITYDEEDDLPEWRDIDATPTGGTVTTATAEHVDAGDLINALTRIELVRREMWGGRITETSRTFSGPLPRRLDGILDAAIGPPADWDALVAVTRELGGLTVWTSLSARHVDAVFTVGR